MNMIVIPSVDHDMQTHWLVLRATDKTKKSSSGCLILNNFHKC